MNSDSREPVTTIQFQCMYYIGERNVDEQLRSFFFQKCVPMECAWIGILINAGRQVPKKHDNRPPIFGHVCGHVKYFRGCWFHASFFGCTVVMHDA